MFRMEWKGFVVGLLTMFVLTGVVFAASGTVPAELLYENIRIFLDGTELEPKDANGTKVEPFILDGTTYVPIRAISEAYGKDVLWNEDNKEIHINKKADVVVPPVSEEMQEVFYTSVVLPGEQQVYPLFMRDIALVDENGKCYAAQTTLYRLLSIARYGYRIVDVSDHEKFKGFREAIDVAPGKKYSTNGTGAGPGYLYDENDIAKKYRYSVEPKDGENRAIAYNNRAYLAIEDVFSFFQIPYTVRYDNKNDNVIIALK